MSLAQKADARIAVAEVAQSSAAQTTALGILFAVSGSHMLNDMMQSLAPALYPVFRDEYSLSFFQTGIITFTFQVTASLLQPLIGMFTDRRPVPYALPFAMGFSLVGLLALAFSTNYPMLLISVALIGIGSAIFHPEASRVARAASGGRFGFAAKRVPGRRQFRPVARAADGGVHRRARRPELRAGVHRARLHRDSAPGARGDLAYRPSRHAQGRGRRAKATLPRAIVRRSIAILVVLLFSKTFYLASLNSYYTFYLMQTFDISLQNAQVLLFVFLGAVAAGTFFGGPIGDRIGRKIRDLGLDPRRAAVHAAAALAGAHRHGHRHRSRSG